jgi:hypothetical protein
MRDIPEHHFSYPGETAHELVDLSTHGGLKKRYSRIQGEGYALQRMNEQHFMTEGANLMNIKGTMTERTPGPRFQEPSNGSSWSRSLCPVNLESTKALVQKPWSSRFAASPLETPWTCNWLAQDGFHLSKYSCCFSFPPSWNRIHAYIEREK